MTTSTLPDLEPENAPAVQSAVTSEERQHTPLEELDRRHFDPTQGREIGSHPYDDPTQGRQIGSHPYDDPTRARY